ncbi:hypothetical protein GBAR_LOCUS23263, partial [Geodia barretti]
VNVAWEESVYTVREDVLSLTACVVVPSDILCRDIEVFVSTADSTMSPQATSGEDYQSLSLRSLILPAGSSSACVTVTVVDDNDAESAGEFFDLVLSSSDSGVIISSSLALTELQNEDVEIGLTLHTICENLPILTACVTVTGESVEVASFNFFTISTGSATAETDYQSNSSSFNFVAGDDPPCLNVEIVDDLERESCETFLLQLSTSDPNVILSPASATATIYDDEDPSIQFTNDTPDITGKILTSQLMEDGCIAGFECQVDNGDPLSCTNPFITDLNTTRVRTLSITANGFCQNNHALSRDVRSGELMSFFR